MIYHFVPFDMRYWNLILHQYKWCIASQRGGKWMAKRSLDVLQFSPSGFKDTLCLSTKADWGLLVFHSFDMYVFFFKWHFETFWEKSSLPSQKTLWFTVCVCVCVSGKGKWKDHDSDVKGVFKRGSVTACFYRIFRLGIKRKDKKKKVCLVFV